MPPQSSELLPDIDVNSLVLDLHVGFDGTIRPEVQVDAEFHDSPVEDVLRLNPDQDFQENFVQQVSDRVNALVSAQTIKQAIDALFVRMMRLDAVSGPPQAAVPYQANIQSYNVDNNGALIVTYSLTEPTIASGPGAAHRSRKQQHRTRQNRRLES
ncbi:MAG: hypothetical protein JO138_22270 [Acidobacteriaceae bacterium]|nr:hypothetical protein [Acidobacteriota bacterium]MBV9502106.1 hypothetical protein [Acidobacteriaceae bacterium]